MKDFPWESRILHRNLGFSSWPQSPALPAQVDEGVAGGRAPVGGRGGHALIHEEPQGHVALRGDIGLEAEAVPKLEAVGEPLPAPVVWNADPRGWGHFGDLLNAWQPPWGGFGLRWGSQDVPRSRELGDTRPPGLHPPSMRRRENRSCSSAATVERNGAHVGCTAPLLTLLFLKGSNGSCQGWHCHLRAVAARGLPPRLTWGSDTQ